MTNNGTVALDRLSHDGGSSLTIGGTLTNDGVVRIGPSDYTLSAASMLEAASVVNNGVINVYGAGTVDGTLSSAGAFTNDGGVNFHDDADTLAGAIGGTGGSASPTTRR